MRKFLLIALFLMGFAMHAAAQGVAFTSTSLPRQMRQEGVTEIAGELVLTALNNGTIAQNSSIDIVFSTPITNNSTLSTNNISLANNISCAGPGFGVNCPAAMSAVLVGTNTVRISFLNSSTVFTIGDSINISRVRVNANSAIGVGSITATMSGISSNPASFPITFTDPQRLVGVLNPTITVNFNHSTATPNPVTLFQTCVFPNDANNDFFVRVTEVFPGALTTLTQEFTFAANLPPTNGSNISITISNIPAGLTLSYTGNQLATGALTVSAPFPASAVDQTVAGTPITFTYFITASDVSLVERTTFNFSLKPTTISTTNPLPIANVGAPVIVQGTVQITPITTNDSTIVRFVANQIGPTTLANISDCPVPGVQPGQITSE